MNPTLTQTIDTLREAQNALRSEMEVWALAGRVDEARLRHLREVAKGFQEQAHSALVMMCYQDTPEALAQEVEELIGAFGDIAGQIEAMLALNEQETRASQSGGHQGSGPAARLNEDVRGSMAPEDMQARIEQLEAAVARLETHARNADGIIALLVGVVAEASGLDLDLDIDRDDMPGANQEWLEYIIERFEMGRDAGQG